MYDIKITGLKMYICGSPPRDDLTDSTRRMGEVGYIIAVVSTDTGIDGVGVTYCEVGNEAITAFAEKVIEPLIIGENPFDTEIIWHKISQVFRAAGRKGLAFFPLSAVDIALWDIKGKVLDIPLYRLFGGNDPQVPAYRSGGWTSYTEEQLVDYALQAKDAGYSMIKIKVGVNGGLNIQEDARRVRAVRKAIGSEMKLAIDANNVWHAGTAIKFSKMVEDYDIEFFEEPVIADDIPGLAHCRSMCNMPIATGEHEFTRYGVRDLCTSGAADIIQIDAAKCGGYTESLKMISVIQAFNLRYAPHCMEFAHMHLVSAFNCGMVLECLDIFDYAADHFFINPPRPVGGIITIPDTPGLGLELNMDWIKKYSR